MTKMAITCHILVHSLTFTKQSFGYITMRGRKHAAWVNDFNYGMMVFGQSGIYDTVWFHRGNWVKVLRELFYKKKSGQDLKSFSLGQMAAPFILLALGYFVSALTFSFEKHQKLK